MSVPAYIPLIVEGHVCLAGDVRGFFKRSSAVGMKKQLVSHMGYKAVKFPAEPRNDLENEALHMKLRQLNALGMLFGEDYKQGCSPAEFMRELSYRRIVTEPFISIAWRGPGDWFTTIHGCT